MYKLLTLFFSLTFFSSFGQTEVKTLKYNLSYSDNNYCYSGEYKISFPQLIVGDTNDVRKKVNDSILSIVKSNLDIVIRGTSFSDFLFGDKDCDTTTLVSAEYNEMYYTISQNTDKLLSLTISSHSTPGYGGRHCGFGLSSFNIDIKRNELFTIDNIFSETNKEKFIRLALLKTDGFTYEDYKNGYFMLLGSSIKEASIIIHCSGYLGNGGSHPIDVEMPLNDIKEIINKKYLKLFSQQ